MPREDGSSVTDAEAISITKVNKWLGDDLREPLSQSKLIHKDSDPSQEHPFEPKLKYNGHDCDLTRLWPGNLCKSNERSTEIQHAPVMYKHSTYQFPPPAPYVPPQQQFPPRTPYVPPQQQFPPQAPYVPPQQQLPPRASYVPPQHQFPPQALFTPLPTVPFLPPNVSEPQTRSLSKNQIAARHLMSKDLPSFDGDPEQWPLFISNFERSTELCGFTDEENVMRLNKALTGKAKTAVRWLLLQPNCFHQVMSRLKTLYGRPELIIQTLLQKVNTTPPPKDGKLETILNFALEVQNLYATIQATGLYAHLNNPSLLTQLEGKLPPTILLNWGIYKMMLPDCTLSHFSAWIYQLAEAANGVLVPHTQTPSAESKGTSRFRKIKPKSGFLNSHSQVDANNNESKHKCYVCQGSCSSVAVCKQFQQLSRTSKWGTVREYQLCRRCLKKHNIRNCPLTSVCGKDNCTFKHHPLLHNDQNNVEKSIKKEIQEVKGNVSVHMKSHCNAHRNNCESTLFRIVPVILYGNGSQIKTFAFLDDGSSLTLMDEELATQLNMKGKPQPLCLKWTGNTNRYENQSQLLTLRISSTVHDAKIYALSDVHTVKNLSLPYQSLNFEDLQNKYEHLKGLPIESYDNQSPRLLIGLKHTKLGLPLKCREGRTEEPVATKTRLGWLVHGSCSQQLHDVELRYQHHNFHICECNDTGLQRLVKDYICMDNFGISNADKVLMPTEDKRALDQLDTNTIRKNGRYETSLLWKFDDFAIPNSLPMAKRRLACLHKRMKREPQLAKSLDEKIKQFIKKGYARKLTKEEVTERGDRCWYLPIFPVFNPNKPGKLRIVWDAAATVQGVSLNSMLLRGPGQLASLIAVLFKFREDLVAIFADIMEMYHQIQIRKEDQHFQRFLWSTSEEVEPEVLAMQVMIMGATSASASAQYVIRKNADEFSAKFPRAVQSIKNNQYVDDLMDSTSSEEKAIQLAKEICYVHLQGGFFIRNWISNSPEVVKAMKSEPTDQVDLALDVEMGTEKVLGMWWCTASDCFTYKINASAVQSDILSGHKRPTKREVLRILMTIFDPLGLVAHFLMYIKVLLQDVWRSNIGWDEDIKDAELEKWLKWIRYLPEIVKLKIPRCYIVNNPDPSSEIQLHVFVDASENGFAAVAYLRIANDDNINCVLIGAKTRVAPLKSLSIPRLELQAAVLGVRFAKVITKSHTIRISQCTFWSDSKNVLSWIQSDHRRYKPFVAYRVSEILDFSEISDWKWISTKLNVADEGTKWQKVPEFKASNRWLTGPEFLKTNPNLWPNEIPPENATVEELKTCFVNLHTLNKEENFRISDTSSWRRLIRTAAYFFRFIHNTSIKRHQRKSGILHQQRKGYLRQEELRSAEAELFREAQTSEYWDEMVDLSSKKSVEKSSILYNLCPYLDADKVIRANSRIPSSADVSEDVKKPIILPRNHPITALIITDLHVRFNHRNHETVINELRQKFHIAHMRSALRLVRKNCQDCKNTRAKPQPPMMAQLPPARIAPFCRPFSFVGVDYFGPMNVSILRRTEKRWGVLLTCLTTRAIHLEIAHSLSADSCILALRNFMARRGVPIEIFSDNGTNFHGAERELREALKEVNTEKLMETFTTTDTKWTFIPPGSPHMGGSWERLVRSVKTSLYDIVPTRNPSDELLRSMLIEVENIVNSRPLTYIPIDDESEEALTPNHFLLGSSNGSKPPAVFDSDTKLLKRNWLISQQYAERFWQRWVREYLPTITRRTKWFTSVKPIEKGDIVLIVDPMSPRNCWPKGRVIQTTISKDGQVRSAFVQTQSGVYEKPAVKLAVLDIRAEKDVSPRSELPRGSVNNPVANAV
ncbi:uncharacterized protein LOC129947476 [Eupeodes corollae]|uniref:uncharacterized protein LOC129947476 n=1 Tax=Eupeodes corollae TaxID=290404 RepID=UPI00249233E4|nr:uncharacterized protein LOC129947476 [Eupeodes corollae]